jgi:hypothetical protein
MGTNGNGSTNGNGNGHAHNGNGNGHRARWWSPKTWGRMREIDDGLGAYRRLAMQLHYDLPRGKEPRSVLLATPRNSPLCAHGSTALACCLAEELGRPVLLIDVSSRKPEITRMLGCAQQQGFTDLIADPSLKLEELAVETSQHNVFFLPAGTGRTPVVSSGADDPASALLDAATKQFDFVLMFGGSVLEDSRALAMAGEVGCVLLMAIEKETRLEDLDQAENALSFCRPQKIGLVLTAPLPGGRWPINGTHSNGH